VSHYRIVPQKSLPRPTIYRQKSALPGGRPAGRTFTGKLLAGGDFSGNDPIMGKLFMGPAIRKISYP